MKFLVFILIISQIYGISIKNHSKLRLKTHSLIKNLSHLNTRLRHRIRHKKQEQIKFNETMRFVEFPSNNIIHKRKRVTVDNKQCAIQFDYMDKTFQDCVDLPSPDGTNTKKEWCMLNDDEKGEQRWNFCKPEMNYDKVREKVRDIKQELLSEYIRISDVQESHTQQCNALNSLVQELETKQSKCDIEMGNLEKLINTLEHNKEKLQKTMKEIDEKNLQFRQMQANLDMMIEKKQIAESLGNEDQVVEDQEEISFLQLHQNKEEQENLVQFFKDLKEKNCEGMVGYEMEPPGDGLKAQYYDNEAFFGEPIKQVDENINFIWYNNPPTNGINSENFSIIWKGWVRAPGDGKYLFHLRCDDGCKMSFNQEEIISHMFGAEGSWLESWRNPDGTQKEIQNFEAEKIDVPSKEVSMIGGEKYFIEIQAYHSIHNEEDESGDSFVYLYWSSVKMQKNIIKKEYLYQDYKIPQTRVENYDNKVMKLSILKEFDDFFMDKTAFKLADVPFQYQGMTSYKTPRQFEGKEFKFDVTAPAIIYLAIDDRHLDAFPKGYSNTQECLSVLEIDELEEEYTENGQSIAIDTRRYSIFQKKVIKGEVNIKFRYTDDITFVNFLMWFSQDSSAPPPVSCGGLELLQSKENAKSCTQSSVLNKDGWDCEAGFSSRMEDDRFGMWATNGQGLGSWIEMSFKENILFTRLQIKNRNDIAERSAEVELSFGVLVQETIKLKLKNIQDIQNFSIQKSNIVSNVIKIKITSVYTSQNNGFSINVFGISCVEPDKIMAQVEDKIDENQKNLEKKYYLGCYDSLINKPSLMQLKLKEDIKIIGVCAEGCQYSQGTVYGDEIYSDDSVICKAAMHSGTIQAEGGQFYMKIIRGQEKYDSNFRNGVKSQSKDDSSAFSFEFKQFTDIPENEEEVELGMPVDIKDKWTDKWVAGIITYIEKMEFVPVKYMLTVSKEGKSDEFTERVIWPDVEKVDRCGVNVKDRDCSMAKGPKTKRFLFGKGPVKTEQYILDSGEIYGPKQDNLVYGWTRNMTDNARNRELTEMDLQANFILFPPDVKSKWCLQPKPNYNCEPVAWEMEVEPGFFRIKISAGDPEQIWQNDLIINGEHFQSDKKSRIQFKDQFYTREMIQHVKSRKIRLESRCDDEPCLGSWSRINTMEITPIENPKDAGKTITLECGLAYQFGKCTAGIDVENCIWLNLNQDGISACKDGLKLVQVPESTRCKDQAAKFKCISSKPYPSKNSCYDACPGECRGDNLTECYVEAYEEK